MPEFQPFPKIARLFRDIVVTEKIDGTNASVNFEPFSGNLTDLIGDDTVTKVLQIPAGGQVVVRAASRTKWVTPSNDNAGWANYVRANAEALFGVLGFGSHFGEWWGAGIQRRYGLDHKRFSLFNVAKWRAVGLSSVPNLDVVPTLYIGPFSERAITDAIQRLRDEGSVAAPGFLQPEGIVVWHEAARQLFKYTLNGDGHKG